MKTKLISALILAAATAPFANAGVRYAAPVVIQDYAPGVGMAWGGMGTARNSTDSVQMVTCWSYSALNSSGAPTRSAGCSATDTTGRNRACYSTNPTVVATIDTARGDAFVQFTYAADGTCGMVAVQNSSQLEARQ